MLFGQRLLSEEAEDDALEDVLLRDRRLHVLHQLVSGLDVLFPQVVDDQVEPGLRQDVHERREDLQERNDSDD